MLRGASTPAEIVASVVPAVIRQSTDLVGTYTQLVSTSAGGEVQQSTFASSAGGGLAVPLGHTFAQLWWPTAAIFFGLTGALVVANFNPIIAVLSATHPLAWSFFFLNMAELVPLAFLFRGHFLRHSDISLPTFILYIAIGDFFANLAQAVGLNMLVLKLDITQILILFVWQWVMAIVIGGPMGYYFYKAVRRSGVFE